jgi:hypothetical protein
MSCKKGMDVSITIFTNAIEKKQKSLGLTYTAKVWPMMVAQW